MVYLIKLLKLDPFIYCFTVYIDINNVIDRCNIRTGFILHKIFY